MGQRGQGKSRGLHILSMKNETNSVNCEDNFLYTTEEYQQLR